MPNVSLFQNGRVKLSNASVPWDSNITLLCQPSFLAYLEQAPGVHERAVREHAPVRGQEPELARPADGLPLEERADRRAPRPPGQGHELGEELPLPQDRDRPGGGHRGLKTPVGYNEEQDYSWARASMFMGAKLLQNAGVVVITATAALTPNRQPMIC
jgi:hypothetical protein